MIPSPADLIYFVEIAHTGNLSRTAEKLAISQPSLSLAVRRLEDSAGAKLLLRSKRGVALTPAGRQLLAHAKSLLQSWESVNAKVAAAMNEVEGSYTIGCHESVALSALPGFLPGLLAEYPGLDISLRHDISRRVAAAVIAMEIDIGIVVNPVRHPDLVIHRLCRDEFTLWAPAGKTPPDVLFCDPDLIQAQFLLKKFGKAGRRFGRIVACGSLEVAASLAAAGGGYALLPGRAARRQGKKIRPVAGAPSFADDHCLIFRVENKGIRAVQAINAAIVDSFRKS
jgi:DNA-binding transcriptional LysR family regulator